MRSIFTLATLASFLPTILGAPAANLKPINRVDGPKKPNSYIITMKQGTSAVPHIQGLTTPVIFSPQLINGFAAELTEDQLNVFRANPNVEAIDEDAIVYATETITQTNATWGLQRISQDSHVSGSPSSLTFNYKYDSTAGKGVDVYVLDTGINTAHVDFSGRARWGATFIGARDVDLHGHGTHCAGTVGGATYGVAKAANLIAVKVLGDDGYGTVSSFLAGLDYVLRRYKETQRPSIISMSLTFKTGTQMYLTDRAVASVTQAGIHAIAAAGNDARDAESYSPAHAPSAITVAASDINDSIAAFSNYGKVIDIIAPGVDVISTYIGSNTAVKSLSGTSMACPHVAGLAAYLIGKDGNKTPAELTAAILNLGIKNVVRPNRPDTINLLANNEF